jgi:hypothetical protein
MPGLDSACNARRECILKPRHSSSAVTTASLSLAVAKQATQTVVSVSASAVSPAQAVTLNATVVAAVAGTPATPTGTVIFLDNGVQLGGEVNVVNGTAQLVVSSLPAGATAVITATYQGDDNSLGSTSSSSASVLGERWTSRSPPREQVPTPQIRE